MGYSPSTTPIASPTADQIGRAYPSGSNIVRVVRIHKRVTEIYVSATTPALAIAAAQAAAPTAWRTRHVWTSSQSGLGMGVADDFEYNAVSSDTSAAVI